MRWGGQGQSTRQGFYSYACPSGDLRKEAKCSEFQCSCLCSRRLCLHLSWGFFWGQSILKAKKKKMLLKSLESGHLTRVWLVMQIISKFCGWARNLSVGTFVNVQTSQVVGSLLDHQIANFVPASCPSHRYCLLDSFLKKLTQTQTHSNCSYWWGTM